MALTFVNMVLVSMLLVVFASNCTSKRLMKTRLIYHSSSRSPFFNATATLEDLSEREIDIFNARIKHFNFIHDEKRMVARRPNRKTYVAAPPQTPLFMVQLTIGDDDIWEVVALDTGSSLLWVYCNDTSSNIHYDPYKSSTHKQLLCGAHICGVFDPYNLCVNYDFTQLCTYQVNYVTGFSNGLLGKETFGFVSRDAYSEVPNIVFGCAYNATIPFKIKYDGVFGLGPRSTSIVEQMGYSGFTYCLGNLSDPEDVTSYLTIEDDSLSALPHSTRLFFIDGHYGVKLENISVAGEMLHITMPEGEYCIAIMDTGASLSTLTAAAYPKFEQAIIKSIGGLLTRSYRFDNDVLCYEGNLQKDLDWFPKVTFYFARGAYMDFGYEHLFYQRRPNVICLAVSSARKTLIGARLQQYFRVTYNVERTRISFETFTCDDDPE